MVHRELLIDGVFIGGVCDQEIAKDVIRSPWDESVVGTAAEASVGEVEAALDAAHRAFDSWKSSATHARQALLRRVAAALRERCDEFAALMVAEIGKPIYLARGEVARAAMTFDLAADALSEPCGEVIRADYDPRGLNCRIITERFPVGPVLAIVPYNWPINLAAHKIAPALAAGNSIIVKASEKAPLSTLSLCRLIHEAGCPPGVLNAVNCGPKLSERMVTDPRVAVVSFTGSPAVGWHVKGLVPEKRVTLELGGDAFAAIGHDVNAEQVARAVALSAFSYAGQVCVSTQHALVHEQAFGSVRTSLATEALNFPTGDPRLEETRCGPMIDRASADRVEEWIEEAIAAGAKPLHRGRRQGNLLGPTVLEDVPPDVRLGCDEVFGPVLTLARFETWARAYQRINASRFGIQAGILTNEVAVAEMAFRELQVGAVIIGDTPSLRFDAMPYGGVKRSGFGREGLRYAIEEMTEIRTMVVRPMMA
jgi:acyl-CoA reductase-like NAD-dependent aldehyde dehydrogenase